MQTGSNLHGQRPVRGVSRAHVQRCGQGGRQGGRNKSEADTALTEPVTAAKEVAEKVAGMPTETGNCTDGVQAVHSETNAKLNRLVKFPGGATKDDIAFLVGLLKTESSFAAKVAKVIASLACEHADAICEAGGIQALVEVLPQGPSSLAVMHAAAALGILVTGSPACRPALMESGSVPHLVILLRAGPVAATIGASVLGSLAIGHGTIEHKIRDAVRDAGGIGMLVQLLTHGVRAKESAIAAAALGNLAIHNPTNQDSIRSEGGVKLMVNMLREENDVANQDVAKQVAGALRNLAANNPANKHAIHTAGGIALKLYSLHLCTARQRSCREENQG
jgi:hypothetical protein